jgi:IS1 family transposase
MNKLSIDKQKIVLAHLIEGNSIRSIQRITGIDQNTIMRLLVKCGHNAQETLDREIQDVPCRFLELDEIWTYVGIKQGHLPPEEESDRGDQYVFVALDADSKLIPCFLVGKRDKENTVKFINELKEKITPDRVQITTDGWKSYRRAIGRAFNGKVRIDYAQCIKHYETSSAGNGRYAPPQVEWTEKREIFGSPMDDHISTSYVERQNLTMRMQMRRFTRLTNGFSKKIENLRAACSLYFFHYNFMRMHLSLRCTPAMAAGISKNIWEWDAIL